MMDMREALRRRQLADAGVSALVGSRVTWVTRPQATGLPAVTLQVIVDDHAQHLEGFDDGRGTRVQLDCWGASYAEATVLGDAVIAAVFSPAVLHGVRFGRATMLGDRDLSEDKPGGGTLYRRSLDIRFWHEGA